MENNLPTSNAGQGMSIAALVLGIVAVVAAFIPCFGLIAVLFGVLAIIFGAIGLSQAKKENAPTTMPIAGLILGIVATAFIIIWGLVMVNTISSVFGFNNSGISKTFDSINVEATKSQDSLNNSIEVTADTVKVEEEK
ncbi:DUF4190 domain-containing protein [Flavobacterium branchiarum]|uniref:DUF4190 domain-containing protein n=1 Tax=Flavobacterium branchiarum TaxID=1114870 RepID=A0ABV5FI81_9FLAO|nr:DUF4190 domain-containing protein [Flavobacterium branchiarum]MDN3674026.1 DUF4190 domain-containing protein [Flavobacterium branchiarum]